MDIEKPKREPKWRDILFARYFPHLLVASIVYFVVAIVGLLSLGLNLIPALLGTVVVYVVLSAIVFFIAPLLKDKEEKPDNLPAKFLFGSPPPATPEDKDDQLAAAQKKLHRDEYIKALRYAARNMHDRVLRMGAVLGVSMILFWMIMHPIFSLSPKETYLMPLPAIVLLWFLQIVLFPKWATYTSFLTFASMRLALQVFGAATILMLLPNFIMLPIFYFLMMIFMFGSIMLPQLTQVKYNKPGEGNWQKVKGSVRGQFIAANTVQTQKERYLQHALGKSKRGWENMLFVGLPGTGKTLMAQEIATETTLPYINADGTAFTGGFLDQLTPKIHFWRADALAKEYGGVIFFIDECELVFGSRSGMKIPDKTTRPFDEWDILAKSNGCLVADIPEIRVREWNEQQGAAFSQQLAQSRGKNDFFLPGGMGGGGGAIMPFLTKMSGMGSVPAMEKFFRSTANALLNGCFVPVMVGSKILRLPPGKPVESNILWIGATNRPWLLDPAITRPGRFGITVEFVMPDEDGRADIAQYYMRKLHKEGYYQDDVMNRVRDFAQATPLTSPAELQQAIEQAVDVRIQHIANLRRIKRTFDEHGLDGLVGVDRKFWLRFRNSVYDREGKEIVGWDDERVDWQALMDARNAITWGQTNPTASNGKTRIIVAYHELGHFALLKVCNSERLKPNIVSIIPRKGSLGINGFTPIDTREYNPQEHYEGEIRTSVASWVTERYFTGQNYPGVSGDLEHATNDAVLMAGKWGMPHYACTPQDEKRYQKIGMGLISAPQISMFDAPQAKDLFASVLGSQEGRRNIAICLGMAAVDAYRVIRDNESFFLKYVPQLLELDEFSGPKLDEIWNALDDELVLPKNATQEAREAWPERDFTVINPLYETTGAEGKEIFDEVMRMVDEAQS